MDHSVLLILTGVHRSNAIVEALDYARSTSSPLRVMQILTSDLYRYGHQDLVATRPSKKQFLLHIRNEVLERGKAETRLIEETAREMGISLETVTIESEDAYSISLAEVKKGYGIVFLPKQERKLFPLFQRTLADYLRRKTAARIIAC